MRVLRRLRVLMAGAVSTLAFTTAAAAAPVPALAAAVHPVPAISGHVLAELLTPPNTALCRATFGFPCYQPFQLQKAYDLAPLFGHGIDGRGRTIVIVDAFGTPTIQDDLKTFDQVFGLPFVVGVQDEIKGQAAIGEMPSEPVPDRHDLRVISDRPHDQCHMCAPYLSRYVSRLAVT